MSIRNAVGLFAAAVALLVAFCLAKRTETGAGALVPAEGRAEGPPAALPPANGARSRDEEPREPATARLAEGAPPPTDEASSNAASALDLAARIDALFESFLTETPDFPALDALWRELAERARVDPASIETSSGTARGRIDVGLAGYEASFMSQPPAGFSVHLVQHGGPHAEEGLSTRFLTIGCQVEDGRLVQRTAQVTHLLDPLDPERVAFDASGSRITGWVAIFGDGAVRAAPWYAMRVLDGKPRQQRGLDRNLFLAPGSPEPFEAWNQILQPHLHP